MKIIYFGTPEFAVKPLEKLIENFKVVAVVTPPDKPVGRSSKLVACPVKASALLHGIPVYQFEKVRTEGVETLKSLNADMMISCAYGQFFSKEILDITPIGLYNIHGSILPKYRGSAPIQWTIINGEEYGGITILKTDIGMDDGDILISEKVKVLDNETAGELFDRLSEVGADLIVKAVKLLESGNYTLTPQDHNQATVCKMLSSDMSKIDFSKPATTVKNMIHGLNPWPLAKITIDNVTFKVFRATLRDLTGNPGEVLVASPKQGLVIGCADKSVEIVELQPENGKRMTAKSYLNGKKLQVGEIAQ